jgi:hypothetical protein
MKMLWGRHAQITYMRLMPQKHFLQPRTISQHLEKYCYRFSFVSGPVVAVGNSDREASYRPQWADVNIWR